MNIIKRGDKYSPKNGEIIGICIEGRIVTCMYIEDRDDFEKYPYNYSDGGLCTGCPLCDASQKDRDCREWIRLGGSLHRVIPVEDVVE